MYKNWIRVAIAFVCLGAWRAHSGQPFENNVEDNVHRISAHVWSLPRRAPRPPPLELYKEYPDLSKGIDADGNPIAEKELFESLGQKMQALQGKLQTDHKAPQIVRGFHAKSIGCLKGELRVLDQPPDDAKFGIFAEAGKAWPIWVRFSGGVGFTQPDSETDVRGMAVKVMGVPGDKLLDDEKNTQDFLMTNFSLPLGKDAKEFMEFAQANANGRASRALFALNHRKVGRLLLKIRKHEVQSVQSEQYWSGSPYHLGPAGELAKAVKFSAKPCSENQASPSATGDNFLTTSLQEHINSSGICFDFLAQFQTDPVKQPIEDTSVDWDETAPFVPVAKIVLTSPQTFDSQAQQQFCDDLNFNPWHSLSEHKPLGNINRARKIVYDVSKNNRPHNSSKEPDGTEEFK